MGATGRRKLLYGIAEHSPWHLPAVSVEEICQNLLVAFAYFAQHPPYCLLNEIILRVYKHRSEFHRVTELIVSYESQSGNYGYSLLPDVF